MDPNVHQPQDAAGLSDQVSVNQPNPDIYLDEEGNLVHPEGVNAPDPRFWGPDADRPDPFAHEEAVQEGAGGVPQDTISEEGVHGPDSRWWTKEVDENGIEQYVGRDDMNYLQGRVDVMDLRQSTSDEVGGGEQ